MRILIVEDDRNKLERLVHHLKSRESDLQIEFAYSFNSGLRNIVSKTFDLLILDMTLPTFDGKKGKDEGRPRPLGGKDLLTQMKLRGISTKAIVVTQYESFGEQNLSLQLLSKELAEEFSFFLGSVYYNASQSTWTRELDSLLAEAISARAID